MLDNREMKQVRDQATLNLPESIDLLSWQGSPDSRGGLVESYAITEQGLAARLAERRGDGLCRARGHPGRLRPDRPLRRQHRLDYGASP